jgi:hypothetical protein
MLYMANGQNEQAEEDAEFDSHDLQCVLHTLDREALKKHDAVQAKASRKPTVLGVETSP